MELDSSYTFYQDNVIADKKYREYYSKEKGFMIEDVESGEQYHIPNNPIIAMRILSKCTIIVGREIIPNLI